MVSFFFLTKHDFPVLCFTQVNSAMFSLNNWTPHATWTTIAAPFRYRDICVLMKVNGRLMLLGLNEIENLFPPFPLLAHPHPHEAKKRENRDVGCGLCGLDDAHTRLSSSPHITPPHAGHFWCFVRSRGSILLVQTSCCYFDQYFLLFPVLCCFPTSILLLRPAFYCSDMRASVSKQQHCYFEQHTAVALFNLDFWEMAPISE